MKTPRTRVAATVAARTLAKGTSKEYAREVAAYLLAEGRVGELDSLLRDVQAEWAAKGYVEVLARSAHPLTDGVKTDIMAQVQSLYPDAKTVTVTEVADPSVIGGVQLSLANQQLDLSVEAKLNKFKQLTGTGAGKE
jgi:F0F1-type ATP synthase delta subunit